MRILYPSDLKYNARSIESKYRFLFIYAPPGLSMLATRIQDNQGEPVSGNG